MRFIVYSYKDEFEQSYTEFDSVQRALSEVDYIIANFDDDTIHFEVYMKDDDKGLIGVEDFVIHPDTWDNVRGVIDEWYVS